MNHRSDTTGALDEALERLHGTGPERLGRLTNHAPMAVEALTARGQAGAVHRWLDLYAPKLEEFPAPVEPVTEVNRSAALGDPRRAADWIAYFERQVAERPWRDVLARWWPRLLPGLYGGSTHPVIRVGHAVRTLEAGGPQDGPRLAELAHGLGYSAARLARVEGLPAWAAAVDDPDEARRGLAELVRAATHRYATHGHGDETMLVHAATAPNAVLRALPALPRALWVPSLHAAWTASAAVTAMYAPDEPVAYEPVGDLDAEEVFARALAHGDEHVIKFADTALDVGDQRALGAVLRAVELSVPLG